jgi:outer membrane protein OmpA-like peptidoglycan-associated protein
MSRAFRVGILIVAALSILAGGVLLIGNKDFLFDRTYRVKADFQSVSGLNNGADVRVGGIHVGTVKEIDLPAEPDGKVTVVMRLKDDTRNIVKKDSVATIKTEGLLGDKYVDVSFGSNKAGFVSDGDAIKGEIPPNIEDVTKDVAAQAKSAAAAFEDNMEALRHNFLLRGFFKNRGYEDSSELTKDAVARLPAGPHAKEFTFEAGRLFDEPDGAKLKDKKALDEAGRFLEQSRFNLAVIAAEEVMGDTAKDRTLTQARAKVIRDYLAENFKLDDTRIKTLGMGKTKNEVSRVRIVVYGGSSGAQPAQKSQPGRQSGLAGPAKLSVRAA